MPTKSSFSTQSQLLLLVCLFKCLDLKSPQTAQTNARQTSDFKGHIRFRASSAVDSNAGISSLLILMIVHGTAAKNCGKSLVIILVNMA